MSLPLTHAGLSAPGISAALDLKFASTLSLTSSSGITPSFSRASTGTYFNSSGVLTSAAINAPRFDHTYNGTSWISRGLLVEEQRTNLAQRSEDFTNAFWTKSTCTISSNSLASPDGNTTADLVVEQTGTVNAGIYTQTGVSVTSGTTYTATSYVKANGRNILIQYFQSNTFPSSGRIAWFDLANKTTQVQSGVTASIDDVGNGWLRIRTTATATASAASGYGTLTVDAMGSTGGYTGNGSSGFYIWGAQLEAGSFPTSYIPTTSSPVTRSADVCQITGSDFSSFWNASEGSFAVEYDQIGQTNNASRSVVLFGTSNGSGSYACYYEDYLGNEYWKNYTTDYSLAIGPTSVGQVNRFAGCVKTNDVAATRNGSAVLTDTSTTIKTGQVALGIGCVADTAPSTFWNGHIARLRYFNKRLTDKQLEDLCRPEDQLKLDLKFSENLSLTPVVGPTPSFSRASTGTYFNSSGVLTSAAINAPRFDYSYDGTNWISKGLLIEEQRTNSLTHSQDATQAIWVKRNGSISSNFALAPDGTMTADKLIPSAASTDFYFNGATTAATSTLSVFAKAAGYDVIRLQYDLSQSATFNLTSGTVTGTSGSSTGTIINVGGGWYRCILTSTAVQVGTNYPIFAINNASFDGTSGVLFWGMQSESGAAFPTSYIPTTTTSVVRSADVCQITGTDFSGFYNQSEGSIVLEYSLTSTNGNPTVNFLRIADAPPGNQSWETGIRLSTNSYFADVYNILSGGYQAQLSGTFTGSLAGKTAFAARANDFAASFNGGTVATDTSGVMPVNIANMYIYANNNHIARLRYYAIRLPNRLLIAKSQ